LNRLLPRYVQKSLCNNNPDAWVEGYTVLFRKTGE